MKALLFVSTLALCSCAGSGFSVRGGIQTDFGTVLLDKNGNITVEVDQRSGK